MAPNSSDTISPSIKDSMPLCILCSDVQKTPNLKKKAIALVDVHGTCEQAKRSFDVIADN